MLRRKKAIRHRGVWAFKFLADHVVIWLTAVFEQLQTPGARVPA